MVRGTVECFTEDTTRLAVEWFSEWIALVGALEPWPGIDTLEWWIASQLVGWILEGGADRVGGDELGGLQKVLFAHGVTGCKFAKLLGSFVGVWTWQEICGNACWGHSHTFPPAREFL